MIYLMRKWRFPHQIADLPPSALVCPAPSPSGVRIWELEIPSNHLLLCCGAGTFLFFREEPSIRMTKPFWQELTNIYWDHGENEIFLTTLLVFFLSPSLWGVGNLSFREIKLSLLPLLYRREWGKTGWFVRIFADITFFLQVCETCHLREKEAWATAFSIVDNSRCLHTRGTEQMVRPLSQEKAPLSKIFCQIPFATYSCGIRVKLSHI